MALAAVCACMIVSSPALPARAGSSGPDADSAFSREYVIKAAILYNFAKFVRWPNTTSQDAGAALNLCVLGEDPFGEALVTIEGKRVGGRWLKVKRIATLPAISGCHMLFVAASEKPRLQQILAAVDGRPILTVADWPGFAKSGGIINLKTVHGRAQIEINRTAVKRTNLRLSAKLLRLATIVAEN